MLTIDPDALRDNAAQASQLLKALSHPDRLMLLCRLAEGERSVSELEPLVEVYQPSLSQQLGILRREGLVSSRREGKQMFYQVANPDALAVLNVLYQRFCGDTP
ncbi:MULTISPECIES: metalloregulator ArsR/SmtB family transcription factor [unclassified Alcanivorax]|jgi:DNA-binding transcriptional ArsR family regulator|uniref:ArsR/SmtB family transcription factor n=1 Tax=unclassified Alcanivorax TaxID=2638842 RepID=UPI00017EB262|nr:MULTISPECIES: metalloregulator ArsR/SmtB family transcription factor [unclassified Alcanivorax]EDX91016.1 transcriptional regulator, ArsR family protein [Alcanivorax sp. DG881]HIL23660.1 ArsR family transcriptional regulator [Alcanivorax sp.]